jgi:hypothetical protein
LVDDEYDGAETVFPNGYIQIINALVKDTNRDNIFTNTPISLINYEDE